MIRIGTSTDMSGIDAAFEEIMRAVDFDLDVVATTVFDKAKRTAQFVDKTGNLRDSIVKKKSKYEHGGYIVQATGKGKKKGYHARNVEFGHVMVAWGKIMIGRRVPPHPFLRPALDEGINEAIARFRSSK